MRDEEGHGSDEGSRGEDGQGKGKATTTTIALTTTTGTTSTTLTTTSTTTTTRSLEASRRHGWACLETLVSGVNAIRSPGQSSSPSLPKATPLSGRAGCWRRLAGPPTPRGSPAAGGRQDPWGRGAMGMATTRNANVSRGSRIVCE